MSTVEWQRMVVNLELSLVLSKLFFVQERENYLATSLPVAQWLDYPTGTREVVGLAPFDCDFFLFGTMPCNKLKRAYELSVVNQVGFIHVIISISIY